MIGVPNPIVAKISSANALNTVEDKPVDVSLNFQFTDNDGSEVVHAVYFQNLPTGSSLTNSAGVRVGTYGKDDLWTITGSQISGLKFVPAYNKDYANYAATITVVTGEKAEGASLLTPQLFNITATPVTDTPNFLVPARVQTNEDERVALSTIVFSLKDDSEKITNFALSGIPTGLRIHYSYVDSSNKPSSRTFVPVNGKYSTTTDPGVGGAIPENILKKLSLEIDPSNPKRSHVGDDFSFMITYTVQDKVGSSPVVISKIINMDVIDIADQVSVSAINQNMKEDTPHSLGLKFSLIDVDGSETIDTVKLQASMNGVHIQ